MAKYYVLKREAGKTQLLETIEAKNVIKAQKEAVKKYMDVVLSTQTQLIVVGESGYVYYKEGMIDG